MSKKGFTLIELLAVILILGIIALIAIPTVNNILKESRKGAFDASARNIVKAAEEKCLTEHMKGNTVREFVFTNGKVSPSLDVKGDLPKSGIITLNENCEANATLSDGDRKYELTYEGSSVEDCTSSNCSFTSNIMPGDEKYECFNFDEETGTILKYNGHIAVCKNDVYVPAMINNVPVTKISFASFSNPNEIICTKNGVSTSHDNMYKPTEEDGFCRGWGYNNNFSFNKVNLEDAGYLVNIEADSFKSTDIKEIKFNDNLRKIGDYAFAYLNTNNIVLPKNLEKIGMSVFSESTIKNLVINNKLKVIEEYAFYGNQILNINIPEGVEYIGEGAFGETSLSSGNVSLSLPNSLKGIGEMAFISARIKNIAFGENLEYIGPYAFNYNLLEKIDLPSNLKEIGVAAFTYNSISEDPFIYNRNSDGSINYKSINSYGCESNDIIIPDGVEELGEASFYASEASNIILPESLKYIREYALSNINLSSITIPANVEIIEEGAFYKSTYGNTSLTSIINKTGRSFDWSSITSSNTENQVFETGTIVHSEGDIIVSK